MSIVGDIYYGVPKYTGAVFRATKAPALLFLFCMLGVPVLASIGMTTYMFVNRSTLPLKILVAANVQQRIERDPNSRNQLPPEEVQLLKELTPVQKALGVQAMNAMFLDSCVAFGAMIWWGVRYKKFRANRRYSRSTS